MAVPTTSAISVAIMAISAIAQSGTETKRGKASRQAWARSRPVAIASRAQSACSTTAMMLDSSGDGQQRIAELRSASERSRPVAGVHVADGDEVARTGEGGDTAQRRAAFGSFDRAVDVGKSGLLPIVTPARIGLRFHKVHGDPAGFDTARGKRFRMTMQFIRNKKNHSRFGSLTKIRRRVESGAKCND